MKILKRDGSYEKLSFDKILYRIRKLANDKSLGPLKSIDPDIIAQKVVNSIFDGISSSELDEEAARLSVGMTEHPEYPKLAARIVVSNLHKSTIECFSEVMEMLYEYTDANGEKVGYISDELIESVRKHKDVLNFCMDFSRDYNFDYFGFKTLERSYLLKINKRVKVGDSFINKMVVVERPQHMYLRVALGLFRDDIDNVLKTYDLISRGMFTFASPTLFNSGLKLGQLSSCFTGDTIVATVNRGPVPIKNIEIGDQVVTHLGNVKRVVQLHCNPLGERRLYQVQTECGHPGLSGSTGVVKVTDNHRVQVNGIGWVSVGDLDPEQHLLSVASGLRGMSFTKQEIVDVNDLPEYVYTLGVEDDHSYTLECGIIAENCFLLGTDDSLSGIFKTMTDCAKISKVAGGIGVHISNIRAKGSLIRGTHGTSDGIVPMLKVYNDISLYINQCFTPDTWVYSLNGPKQMCDITTNDFLITHDGSFKKVNEVMINNVKKQILEIRATNTLFPIKVTKEHEIYLIKDQQKITNFSVIINRLNKGLIKPDFYDAAKLTENDLVGFPLPTYIKDNENHDLDFYKFYGMMLGDGYHCNNGYYEYGITLNTISKNEEIQFVKYYLQSKNLKYWCNQLNGCIKISWYDGNNMKLKLSRDLLYDKSNIKRIHTPYLHLPKDKILKIVEGLLKTDGSNLKELYFTNTSLQLIMQMRYLFLRLGILTSGSVKNNIGKSHITKSGREIITKQISYVLRIPKHPNLKSVITFKQDGQFFKYFEWNGILWGRIKSIKHINYEGPVYDFNMIDNHNYLTDTGLVHNSGKRKGSFSVYLETWHADIFEFLDLKKNQGHDNVRARDLFYAMWIPDLFMKRVEENGDWYLMCPDECPGLQDAYGDKFDRLYNGYVEENRYRKKIKAQDLWFKILEAQIETGTPYMLYKDSVNKKSNQREYGTIRSSNLCVRGDTLILTNTGYHPIEHLKDQNVGVWNGHEWSKVTVKQTGTGQQLLRVTLNDGSSLDCTDYHKFYDPRGNEIRAGDLVKGTELLSAKKFPIIREGTSSETQSVPVPYTFGLLDKDPPINCDLATKLRWLEGFFEGRRGLTFRYSADQLPFINQLRLFFNTLGVIPRIVQTQDSYWHVSIILRDIQLLTNLGLKRCPSLVAGTFNGTPRLIVTDIEKLPGTFDTFCFTEPLRGKGIFNGILTGQCSEITLYSDPNETAVCNLLSIALPKFVDTKKRTFNFEELKEVARYAVRGMNKVIDVNYYSTPESEYSNKKHRPIGLGIQGENDVFIMMRYPFESAEARQLNKDMFEAIYYGAVEGSIDMAEEDGPYSTYAGSPFSQGLLQFDLWAEHDPTVLDFLKESRWDWKNLKERMKKHGMRNSMLTTCMPTASTAQILGNTECMEPIDSCIFKRRVLSGDFTVINKHLVEDLMKLGLWSNEMKERIIIDNGSIQRIPEIPDDIKALYKTVWEISQKTLIDYSADRGPFIDHSQSLNLFVEKPTLKKLTSMHFYGWKKGLKTGMYYLRSKSAAGAAKFSVDATLEAKSKDAKYTEEEKLACSLANPEACEACSG